MRAYAVGGPERCTGVTVSECIEAGLPLEARSRRAHGKYVDARRPGREIRRHADTYAALALTGSIAYRRGAVLGTLFVTLCDAQTTAGSFTGVRYGRYGDSMFLIIGGGPASLDGGDFKYEVNLISDAHCSEAFHTKSLCRSCSKVIKVPRVMRGATRPMYDSEPSFAPSLLNLLRPT